MNPYSSLLIALLPLAVIFFVLSLIKTSLRSLSKVTLRRLADGSGSGTRRLLHEFLDNPTEFILHIQGMIQLSVIAIAVLATAAIVRTQISFPVGAALVLLGTTTLVFEHFFPRYVMSVDRERLLTRLLPAYDLLEPFARLLASPVSRLYRLAFRARPGKDPQGEVSEEEVRAFIDVGEEAGIFDEAGGEMIESVVDFSETLVREVMTPRLELVSIEATKTVAELRDLFIENRYSRIPVYRDRPDNIEGVVYIKDILVAWRDGKDGEKVSAWMKPAAFVPENKNVSSLLKEFQRGHVTFAVVVDEYGDLAGVVTLDDLIEEIVGEIKDEPDGSPAEAVEEPDGSWLLAGKVEIEKLEELFGLGVAEADYETVAGLVFTVLGRVPAQGEEFTHMGLRFQVVNADRHRVNQVRVRRVGPSIAAGPEPEIETRPGIE